VAVRRGIDRAVAAATASLRALARPLAGDAERAALAAVATCGDAALVALVADAFARAGAAGRVLVEPGRGRECRVVATAGARLESGYVSAYFVTEPAEMRCVLDEPLVLLTHGRLGAVDDVLRGVEAARESGRPLLVLAGEVADDALALLVVNHLRGIVRACAVRLPAGAEGGAWCADVAALSGASVLGDVAGPEPRDLSAADLGALRRAVVDRGSAVFEAPGDATGPRLAAHLAALARERDGAASRFDRERLEQRHARLAGGIVAIEVGADTELERDERQGRLEDAVHAVRAGLEEGIVPGGGVALVRAAAGLADLSLGGDAQAGVRAVAAALGEPARQIAANAGREGAPVLEQIRAGSGWHGYDAELDRFADLGRAGVADPLLVVRTALATAAATAGLLLTTDALVVEGPDEGPDEGPGGGSEAP
jgi:chaperonin GroEL